MEEFVTVEKNVCTEIIEKKSKFITNLFYVETIEEAERIINQIKKKYFDAKHNCIAYRIVENGNIVEKSSDDGEPTGTAGLPMLNILQKNNLSNVLVVVTRYFGGILLGTGGLVRAYSNSLLKAIEQSKKITKCLCQQYEVKIGYNQFENFKYYCKKNDIYIEQIDYLEDIMCIISIQNDKKQDIEKDFQENTVIIKDLKKLSIKYVTKSI